MKPIPFWVVFDCNVCFQAMVSPNGPAGRCVRMVRDGSLKLFVSDYVLAEIRDLPNDPQLVAKFQLTAEQAEAFIASIISVAQHCKDVPEVYQHPHDPDDSHYVNLAIANDARLIVSRDRHLLSLMDLARKEAQDFRRRFPTLRVLDPVSLLGELDQQMA